MLQVLQNVPLPELTSFQFSYLTPQFSPILKYCATFSALFKECAHHTIYVYMYIRQNLKRNLLLESYR